MCIQQADESNSNLQKNAVFVWTQCSSDGACSGEMSMQQRNAFNTVETWCVMRGAILFSRNVVQSQCVSPPIASAFSESCRCEMSACIRHEQCQHYNKAVKFCGQVIQRLRTHEDQSHCPCPKSKGHRKRLNTRTATDSSQNARR